MPTPPLSDEICIEALRLLKAYDGNITAAAEAAGLNRNTLRHRLREGHLRGLNLSKGAREAVGNARLSTIEAQGGWIHNYDADGKKVGTTRWVKEPIQPEDYADRLRSAFSEPLPPAEPVAPPEMVNADLCTVHPLMDVHLAMHAWPDETGAQSYSLKEAAQDMATAAAKIDAMTPQSARAVLLIGGDFFHGDDETAQTPRNKHSLDVDSRHWKVLRTGRDVVERRISALLSRHGELVVRVMRGNHDPHAHMALSLALESRYREEPRVTVEDPARDIFWHEWGRCLISGHHGDNIPPQRLYQLIADQCPFWSSTYHRYCFVGHGHHREIKDFGGLSYEMLQPFCPPDAHAARMGYAQRRALHSITFHKADGLVVRAQDPISRG